MADFSSFLSFFRDPEVAAQKKFLRTVPLFKGLENRELGILYQSLYERTYLKGEPLFEEGDIGRALFIIASGKIKLTKKDPDGKEQTLATLEEGNYFGEMTLVDEMPRSASAVAAEDSNLYLLYKSKLEGIMVQYPRIGVAVMTQLGKNLSARLRDANMKMVKAASNGNGASGAHAPEKVSDGEKAD